MFTGSGNWDVDISFGGPPFNPRYLPMPFLPSQMGYCCLHSCLRQSLCHSPDILLKHSCILATDFTIFPFPCFSKSFVTFLLFSSPNPPATIKHLPTIKAGSYFTDHFFLKICPNLSQFPTGYFHFLKPFFFFLP